MRRLAIRIVSAPLYPLLGLYLWLWDEEAMQGPNSYLHRKVIWEIRRAIHILEKGAK